MTLPPRPDDPLELLVAPPDGEYALLELNLEWEGLVDAEAQLAAALRLFVVTRDPLDWLTDRSGVWATANANGDVLELPVYVVRDDAQRRMETSGGDLATAIGPIGEMVVTAAARCQGIILAGAYPELAFRGEVPRLLEQRPDAAKLGTPRSAFDQGVGSRWASVRSRTSSKTLSAPSIWIDRPSPSSPPRNRTPAVPHAQEIALVSPPISARHRPRCAKRTGQRRTP